MPYIPINRGAGRLFEDNLNTMLEELFDGSGGSLADLGVTATAAELNQLDGVTLGTFAEENTADYVQSQATWNTGTDTTESTITAAKLDDKIEDKIEDKFNATGTAPFYACRAWARLTPGNPPTLVASGNVTSITRIATGNYEVTLTTAMPSVNYAIVCGSSDENANANVSTLVVDDTFTPTTTVFRLRLINTGAGASDTLGAISSFAVFA